MRLIHSNGDRVIIQLIDGTIVTLTDECFTMKAIPGRKKSERKRVEWGDVLAVNDMLRAIYPLMPSYSAQEVKVEVSGLEELGKHLEETGLVALWGL